MSKEKGILIIATKHPFYGRCAFNLAATIKVVEKDFPVAVMCSGRGLDHLTETQKKIFDEIIEIEESGVAAKIEMYAHSPFKKTLYVDADNAWLPIKKPSELLLSLDGIGFTAITEGRYDIESRQSELNSGYETWGDLQESISAHKLSGIFYQWRTEVVYFEKRKEISTLFKTAKQILLNPKVTTKQFNGEVPDEYAINVATCKLGISPHEYKWNPCFWERIQPKHQRRLKFAELYGGYFIISTGGNRVLPFTQDIYTRVVKSACYKLGLQFLFPLQSKVQVIAERKLY